MVTLAATFSWLPFQLLFSGYPYCYPLVVTLTATL